jgi:hypothetical protein
MTGSVERDGNDTRFLAASGWVTGAEAGVAGGRPYGAAVGELSGEEQDCLWQ